MTPLQEQLNKDGTCCDQWVDVEYTVTHEVTSTYTLCVPVTLGDPLSQEAELASKLAGLDIPPDLTGQVELVRKHWKRR